MASHINAPTKGNEKLSGQCQDAKKEAVHACHESEPGATKAGGGGLAGAKATVTKIFESAKDAIPGQKKDNKGCEK
ncbi:hypothetical protein HHK36_002643 [Tetracentron sinense]|uniref:Uncharacterized protein n=1 Tax=Tetracentron sinense TaxID=13715 RepID=A0A834ZVZ6_TETSI|nr:hypothetical protein HHK36_002643 [Tetracentron sinense]